MKEILKTTALGVICAVVLVVACYMAAGMNLALVAALICGVMIGATVISEYLELRRRREVESQPPPLKVFTSSAMIGPNGEIISTTNYDDLPEDMPDALKALLTGEPIGGGESPIVKLIRKIDDRGAGSGMIQPRFNEAGEIVDFDMIPDHGLSDEELREIEDKFDCNVSKEQP